MFDYLFSYTKLNTNRKNNENKVEVYEWNFKGLINVTIIIKNNKKMVMWKIFDHVICALFPLHIDYIRRCTVFRLCSRMLLTSVLNTLLPVSVSMFKMASDVLKMTFQLNICLVCTSQTGPVNCNTSLLRRFWAIYRLFCFSRSKGPQNTCRADAKYWRWLLRVHGWGRWHFSATWEGWRTERYLCQFYRSVSWL